MLGTNDYSLVVLNGSLTIIIIIICSRDKCSQYDKVLESKTLGKEKREKKYIGFSWKLRILQNSRMNLLIKIVKNLFFKSNFCATKTILSSYWDFNYYFSQFSCRSESHQDIFFECLDEGQKNFLNF